MSKRLKEKIIGFEAVNQRICLIRIRGKFFNYSFINVHASIEEKLKDEKESFYERVYIPSMPKT